MPKLFYTSLHFIKIQLRNLSFIGTTFCLLCLFSCQEKTLDNSLTLAEAALKKSEIADAEMYFERYLRLNPKGDKRWYVWQQLNKIALQYRQEKKTTRSYLEIMLLEFEADPQKKRTVAMELADIASSLHDDERAIRLWEELLHDEAVSAQDKAKMQRSLSAAYLRRLDFTLATKTLEECVTLEVSQDTKGECLYDLAVTQTLTDNFSEAEKTLHRLLEMKEVQKEKQVLAIYTLADVLEQQERYAEALTLFESIRTSYPNEKVIEIRLANLASRAQR